MPRSAYLSVINWPDSFDEPARVSALVQCAGMDQYQAMLASRRNTPGIMTRIDSKMRQHVANAMLGRGILCIAPTHDEVAQYPQPDHAHGIEQFPDADPARFVVISESHAPWSFTGDQVKLVISGHIKSIDTKVESSAFTPISSASESGYDLPRVTRNINVTQLLDFHIKAENGIKLVRLIGKKTRIGIVGDDSPPSLLDDSRPIELVHILMPDVPIDTEFYDFDPPGNIRALALKKGGRSSELGLDAWSFYSPWVGIMKQSLYGW